MVEIPDDVITIVELARRLHLHPVTVRGLWRARKIPGLKLGHRTLRFSWPDVFAALRRSGDPSVAGAQEAAAE